MDEAKRKQIFDVITKADFDDAVSALKIYAREGGEIAEYAAKVALGRGLRLNKKFTNGERK